MNMEDKAFESYLKKKYVYIYMYACICTVFYRKQKIFKRKPLSQLSRPLKILFTSFKGFLPARHPCFPYKEF